MLQSQPQSQKTKKKPHALLFKGSILAAALSVTACQSLPEQPHLESTRLLSERIDSLYQDIKPTTPEADDQLSNALSEQRESHPELSGYYPIVTGASAFAARTILSDMATRSIDIQYYIWHNDQAGQMMLQALWEAADRGVIVRLLLDDFNGSAELDEQLLRFASHPNIAVRLINPFIYREHRMVNFVTSMPRINRRMHNKSMTFDRQLSIIGGRNIGNEYLNNDQNNQFADLDVLLIGPVIHDIEDSFVSYWRSPLAFDIQTLADSGLIDTDTDNANTAHATTRPLTTAEFMAGLDKMGTTDDALHSSIALYREAIAESTIDSDLLSQQVPFRWATMQFLSDDVKKITKEASAEEHLVHKLRALLGTPNKKLSIISSYFVPTKDGVDTLVQLAESGVKIRILTNSFDATDVAVVHSGYSQWRPRLLKAGVELYELKSTVPDELEADRPLWRGSSASTSLHAKTFAVDDHQVFIGSYNVDPRSANINTELGVVIDDDALAAQLHQSLTSADLLKQAHQVKIDKNGDLYWQTMQDGKLVTLKREPKIKSGEQMLVSIMSWLPIDWML